MVEFIVGLEADAPVRRARYFVQAENVLVEVQRFVQIQHSKLNQTRSQCFD
jgi:hypothetical protein